MEYLPKPYQYVNIFKIGKSLNFVSIDVLIHFVTENPNKDIFKIKLDYIDWKILLHNAKWHGSIPDTGEPYTATTKTG